MSINNCVGSSPFFFCLDKINYSRLIRKGDYFTQKERNVTGTIFSQDTFVFALDL